MGNHLNVAFIGDEKLENNIIGKFLRSNICPKYEVNLAYTRHVFYLKFRDENKVKELEFRVFLLKENSDFESFARNSVSDSAVCIIPDFDKEGGLNSLETVFKRELEKFCKILVLKDEDLKKTDNNEKYDKFLDNFVGYVHYLNLNENSSLEKFVKFVETTIKNHKRKSGCC